MDLATYESLAGITVPASEQTKVTARIAQVQSILETLLGFTLTPADVLENLYSEMGKTSGGCSCSNEPTLPADPVIYAYRLYRYTPLVKYLYVDPFITLEAVKLVKDGVTIHTFDEDEIRVEYGQNGLAKYIEINCENCFCECWCDDCVQLAVDAEWVWESEDDIPLDLQYVWADMVTFYSDDNRDLKSERLATHSYTKERRKPEDEVYNRAVIKKYAGPYSPLYREILG